VPSYLVETDVARERAASVRSAAARLRFAQSIYIPEDETCFFVFDALSLSEAALAAQIAGLEPVRVVEAIPSGREEP
jgi:hypothetical protein